MSARKKGAGGKQNFCEASTLKKERISAPKKTQSILLEIIRRFRRSIDMVERKCLVETCEAQFNKHGDV